MKKPILRIALALTLLAGVSMYLTAGSPYQYTRTYYTDASKTTPCGETMVTCSGSQHWGCYSSYHDDIYDAPCGGSGGGGGNCRDTLSGQCTDGIDNDLDGKWDWDDDDCTCGSSWESSMDD